MNSIVGTEVRSKVEGAEAGSFALNVTGEGDKSGGVRDRGGGVRDMITRARPWRSCTQGTRFLWYLINVEGFWELLFKNAAKFLKFQLRCSLI